MVAFVAASVGRSGGWGWVGGGGRGDLPLSFLLFLSTNYAFQNLLHQCLHQHAHHVSSLFKWQNSHLRMQVHDRSYTHTHAYKHTWLEGFSSMKCNVQPTVTECECVSLCEQICFTLQMMLAANRRERKVSASHLLINLKADLTSP